MLNRKTACAVIFGLACLPFVASAGNKQPLPSGLQHAGTITAVLPHASLVRSSNVQTRADFGADFAWSDIIRTDGNGRVRVRLSDDSILSIGENSELQLVNRDTQARRTVIQLGYGSLRAQITHNTGEAFEVRTTNSVAVVTGADFGVDATVPGQVRFVCLEGTVHIASDDPRLGSLNCEAGNTVIMQQGIGPIVPHPASDTQLALWRNITDPEEPAPFQPLP